MKVQSAFFFHGRFMDYKNTFKMIDEPNYSVELVTDADVGILLLKDWFKWAGESKPLTAGMCLTFCLRSEVTYENDRTDGLYG